MTNKYGQRVQDVRSMFNDAACACHKCLDVPVGTAQAHKTQIQESIMATRFLSITLRRVDSSPELFSDRPMSSYKVAPLVRLEDEWLRAEGVSA